MSKREYGERYAHLQKLLLPVNIVVVVIALLAAISIIFLPLVSIDLGKVMETVSEEVAAAPQEALLASSEPSDGNSGNGSSSSSDEVAEEAMQMVAESLNGVKISLTTKTIAEFAFSDEPKQVLANEISSMLGNVAERVVVNVAVTFVKEEIDFEELGLDKDAAEKIDVDAVFKKLEKLEKASSEAEKDAVIKEFAEMMADQFGLEKDEETIESIEQFTNELYDYTVEQTGGPFSLEGCICAAISTSMNGEDGEVYTSYQQLAEGLMDSESFDSVNETLDMVGGYLQYVAIALFFFAGVWVILALIAFIRIFLKNKRFTMWYVKLFGCYPCLIFGVLPVAAGAIMSSMGGEVAAMAGVFGAISSLTWISGACYLALWIISIFWAFPIKRKIRKEIRAAKG